jgi:hypothetical protein
MPRWQTARSGAPPRLVQAFRAFQRHARAACYQPSDGRTSLAADYVRPEHSAAGRGRSGPMMQSSSSGGKSSDSSKTPTGSRRLSRQRNSCCRSASLSASVTKVLFHAESQGFAGMRPGARPAPEAGFRCSRYAPAPRVTMRDRLRYCRRNDSQSRAQRPRSPAGDTKTQETILRLDEPAGAAPFDGAVR